MRSWITWSGVLLSTNSGCHCSVPPLSGTRIQPGLAGPALGAVAGEIVAFSESVSDWSPCIAARSLAYLSLSTLIAAVNVDTCWAYVLPGPASQSLMVGYWAANTAPPLLTATL